MIDDSDDVMEVEASTTRRDLGVRGKSFMGHFKKKTKKAPVSRTLRKKKKNGQDSGIGELGDLEDFEFGLESDSESCADADVENNSSMDERGAAGGGGEGGRRGVAGEGGGEGGEEMLAGAGRAGKVELEREKG